MSNKFKRNLSTVLASLAMSAIAAPSYAALTTYVNPQGGTNGNERCLVGPICMGGGAYNGTVSLLGALERDMGLAAGSITGVDDGIDQIWRSTVNSGGQVLARARYAGDGLDLGYDSGSGYLQLIGNVANRSVLVNDPTMFSSDPRAGDFAAIGNTSWTVIPVDTSMMFAFILDDTTTGSKWSSNNSGSGVASNGYASSGNRNDHMVTYRISDNHYIIAWEDRSLTGADKDYNDFIAEVNFVTPVPLPAAIFLFGPALLGLIGLARRHAKTVTV